MTPTLNLDARIVPQQLRAHQRSAAILRTTEMLLVAQERITTSEIAARAGVPVGSVYRYYPNVLAIYRALFEKLNGELRTRIAAVAANAGEETTWEALLGEILAQAADLYRQNPAYGRLIQMMTDPALQAVRQECVEETSKIFADRWRSGKDGFHGGDVDQVARTAAKLFTIVEESYFEQQRSGGTQALEMIKALRAYLALHLSP